MKRYRLFNVVAATLTSISMLATQSAAWAAGPQDTATSTTPGVSQQIVDVALGSGGTLRGQLVNASGVPTANAVVSVRLDEAVVAVTKTDERGYFVVQGLRGGVYQVSAPGAGGVYRLWAAHTAPPTAAGGALLVAGSDVFRGQFLGGFMSGGTALMVGMAATIVIAGAVERGKGS